MSWLLVAGGDIDRPPPNPRIWLFGVFEFWLELPIPPPPVDKSIFPVPSLEGLLFGVGCLVTLEFASKA
jgi:hypothetical protein